MYARPCVRLAFKKDLLVRAIVAIACRRASMRAVPYLDRLPLEYTTKEKGAKEMKRFKSYKMDPRIIEARFDSTCKETGKAIKKGQECVYYPKARAVYHMESKTAYDFKGWHEDVFVLGHNY
jgi:hypothetical protein